MKPIVCINLSIMMEEEVSPSVESGYLSLTFAARIPGSDLLHDMHEEKIPLVDIIEGKGGQRVNDVVGQCMGTLGKWCEVWNSVTRMKYGC